MARVNETDIGQYEIHGVSQEELESARRFLGGGLTGIDEDSGTAVGASTRIDYDYDRTSGLLRLTVSAYPANLVDIPPHIASRALKRVLHRAFTAPDAASVGASKPGRYGVYDYVIPTLTNNTRFDLNFSTQTMGNGTLYSYTGTVKSGASGELFEADSTKLSGTGVGGTVVYLLSDGTPLAIEFFLNTIWTHTFTAGFTGPNAGRYPAPVVADVTPSLDGYTYLNPTITIANS